tara:strand:+ start:106 stop:492 length:387 start_codon:yes stop_codon:yes gene_type:complete
MATVKGPKSQAVKTETHGEALVLAAGSNLLRIVVDSMDMDEAATFIATLADIMEHEIALGEVQGYSIGVVEANGELPGTNPGGGVKRSIVRGLDNVGNAAKHRADVFVAEQRERITAYKLRLAEAGKA